MLLVTIMHATHTMRLQNQAVVVPEHHPGEHSARRGDGKQVLAKTARRRGGLLSQVRNGVFDLVMPCPTGFLGRHIARHIARAIRDLRLLEALW